jgi:hypothetical protein
MATTTVWSIAQLECHTSDSELYTWNEGLLRWVAL